MATNCPSIHPALIIGDDAQLIATLSSVLALKNSYLAVMDGPRMQRPDAESEIIRRNNAAVRIKPRAFFFAGLPNATCVAFDTRFPANRCFRINNLDDLRSAPHGMPMRSSKVLKWGRNHIGLGLLTALRSKLEIEFTNANSSNQIIDSNSRHLVICEEGNDLSQVIAANYAYSINAGLCLIPEVPEHIAEKIREGFYSSDNQKEQSQTNILEELKSQLRDLGKDIPIKGIEIITFISQDLPWGFAFTEMPSCHLPIYPDLGISLINGISAEQINSPPIRVAAVIDPQTLVATEVELVAKALAKRSVVVRGYRGAAATVNEVSRLIELLPYDFLLIATHCGDASGWRWTFNFVDSKGIDREFVLDVAIGVSQPPGQEMLEVTQVEKFVSIDGVDWNDTEGKEAISAGGVLLDYLRLVREEGLEPSKKETIDRVPWSAVLKMYDHNFILLPRPLADNGTPIILNNACCSWHQLSGTFMFGNARAYIGTLFSVMDSEASDIALRVIDRYYGKPLAAALWRAQNDIYKDSIRRPYIFVGTHFQHLKTQYQNNSRYLLQRLIRAEQSLSRIPNFKESISDYIRFLKDEIKGLMRYLSSKD